MCGSREVFAFNDSGKHFTPSAECIAPWGGMNSYLLSDQRRTFSHTSVCLCVLAWYYCHTKCNNIGVELGFFFSPWPRITEFVRLLRYIRGYRAPDVQSCYTGSLWSDALTVLYRESGPVNSQSCFSLAWRHCIVTGACFSFCLAALCPQVDHQELRALEVGHQVPMVSFGAAVAVFSIAQHGFPIVSCSLKPYNSRLQ